MICRHFSYQSVILTEHYCSHDGDSFPFLHERSNSSQLAGFLIAGKIRIQVNRKRKAGHSFAAGVDPIASIVAVTSANHRIAPA